MKPEIVSREHLVRNKSKFINKQKIMGQNYGENKRTCFSSSFPFILY